MVFPTLVNWSSPLLFCWLLGGIVQFFSNCNSVFCKQKSGDPNQRPLSVASDLGLHSSPMSHKKDCMPTWVKNSLDILNVEFVIRRKHSNTKV